MSKTTIATPAPCTEAWCREAVHTGSNYEHVVDEVKTEHWEICVSRFVDPEVMEQEFYVWVKIEEALMDAEAVAFASDLARLSEVCRQANLRGALGAAA